MDPARWAENYAATLNSQALALSSLERAEDALPLHEVARLIVQEGYERGPGLWAEAYATSLISMASTYDNLGHSEDALHLIEEAQSIRRKV